MIRYRAFLLFLLVALLNSSISFAQSSLDYDDLELEFQTDTASVEQDIDQMLDDDSSTLGMIDASIEYEKRYDALLNKYYKILYNSLGLEGKKALKASQLNWIKFRDSEKELISEINAQTYEEAGGGTIWGVIATSTRSEITKKRVVELFNYLMYGKLN